MSDQHLINAHTGYIAQDLERPQPTVVTPGATNDQAPSEAVVLFDGKDLSQWRANDGGEPSWKVADGYMEVVPQSGHIVTRQHFGDVQLHLEFASPAEVVGEAQGRGNSGVFFCDYRYEVQVLDNYQNPTYADGVVGAIYSQYPPLANAIRPPGEWNSYDIIWEAPRFDGERLIKPAYLTVLLNGVLVQNHVELLGGTKIKRGEIARYEAHDSEGPITLQDHNDPVRFRNIWVRPL